MVLRTGTTSPRDEMAQLEFLFIDALDHSEHGIPNLESQIAESPVVFVQALALAYKRRDDREDPPEWRIENPEQRATVASAAHRLLNQFRTTPGTDEDGRIDTAALSAWLAEVRRLCREYGRAEIGDQCLGQLLAKAPEDENDTWPCEAICEAMEEIGSTEIGRGFYMGLAILAALIGAAKEVNRSANWPRNTNAGPSTFILTIPMSAGSLRRSLHHMDVRRGGQSEAKITKRLGH